MIVVLDANVFVSALIKDSLTRRIIMSTGHTYLFPEIIEEEIGSNRGELLKKSGLKPDEFDGLIETLRKYVQTVSTDALIPFHEDACKIMKDIDPKDVPYIAAALAFEGSVIWSNDRHFEKQNKIKVLKTKDLAITLG